VSHFWTSAGPTGSGKTYAATTFACERVRRGVKTALVQPTVALCKQSYKDARDRCPDINERIRAIVSGRGSRDKTVHRITTHHNVSQ
jgi:superfamily II DNA or RNA helicase